MLNVFIFTFFTTMLNFSLEYDVTFGFSDNLLSLVFTDMQDKVNRVNPCIRKSAFKYLTSNLTK